MEQSQIDDLKSNIDTLRQMTSWPNQKAAQVCEDIDKIFWKSKDKAKFGQRFVEFGGPELLLSILNAFEKDGLFKVKGAWETAYIIYNCLCNASESSILISKDMGKKGVVKLCAHNIVQYRGKMSLMDVKTLVTVSLSILANMSVIPANRRMFREEGVAEKLQPFLQGDPFLKTICMITLAYIVEEGQEENLALKGADTTVYLVGILKDARRSPDKRYKGLRDIEIAQALARLAVHDQSKQKIADAGVLPILQKMLLDKSTDAQEAAANVIWNLAFSEDIRLKLADDPACIATLTSLSKSPANNVADTASGALWVITKKTGKEDAKGKSQAATGAEDGPQGKKSENKAHIMISYQWGSQPLVLQIRDALKGSGHNVWVDVDEMSGSTLQAMAEAVENARIVLMCISERYKESPNCRTEAEYAFQLRKTIIPIMVEEYYRPDGWLGIILGSKLYMDLSGRLDIGAEIKKILKEVETHDSKAEDGSSGTTSSKAESRDVSKVIVQKEISGWSKKHVADWIAKYDLGRWRPALEGCDGKFLQNLCILRKEAPEFFYATITDEQKLKKLNDIFKLTSALDALTNS